MRVKIPDTFCTQHPDRDLLWHEEVQGEITRIAKKLPDVPLPSHMPKFAKAWQYLSRDMPDRKPEKCPLRRRLIERFYYEIRAYVDSIDEPTS